MKILSLFALALLSGCSVGNYALYQVQPSVIYRDIDQGNINMTNNNVLAIESQTWQVGLTLQYRNKAYLPSSKKKTGVQK